jgi:glycosyltransferase involved in cell wall biosynthesis
MRLYFLKKIISFYVFYLKFFNRKHEKTKKQIVYFNTHDKGGGAAKICFQLFERNENSVMFVKNKRRISDEIIEFDPDLWNRIGGYARYIERKKGILDFGKIGVLKLLSNFKFQNSSIIHLHNSHGYYLSFYSIEKIITNKKLVWTLHDDFILTGHCSFSMFCDKWILGCGNCPSLDVYPSLKTDTTQINLIEKIATIKKNQPYIVTPSKWLAERVQLQFPFLKNIEVIYNGVDINVFRPFDKIKTRSELGLPLHGKIVLYVAEFSTLNPFKGGEIIRDIIRDLQNYNVFFITVGGKNQTNFQNHLSYPYISDDIELAKLYSACDVLLYPTQADNLPLVVLESMACGTPVIASKLGGISEIIDDLNGFLIEDYRCVEVFKVTLIDFLSLSNIKIIEIRKNALKTIKERFTLDKMLTSYDRIYKLL